jgi:hypothetical protein
LAHLIALAACAAGTPCARAQAEGAREDKANDSEDTVEIGGSPGTNWSEEPFPIELNPEVGWLASDGVEWSGILRFVYEIEAAAGARASTKHGARVFGPSYRFHPIRDELVFAFRGLGVGVGRDGDRADFELVPRVGLNIDLGRSGVLNPALRVPIQFGSGFAVELAVTTRL